jgi:hypothetical protein
VSELVRGVLEVEEVPKAGFLPLWCFTVSGGVLCILTTRCGRAVLVVFLVELLLDEEIFAWSPAAATLTRCWRRRGCCARDVGLVNRLFRCD